MNEIFEPIIFDLLKHKEVWIKEVIDLINVKTYNSNISFYTSNDFFFLLNKGYNEKLTAIDFIIKYL